MNNSAHGSLAHPEFFRFCVHLTMRIPESLGENIMQLSTNIEVTQTMPPKLGIKSNMVPTDCNGSSLCRSPSAEVPFSRG